MERVRSILCMSILVSGALSGCGDKPAATTPDAATSTAVKPVATTPTPVTNAAALSVDGGVDSGTKPKPTGPRVCPKEEEAVDALGLESALMANIRFKLGRRDDAPPLKMIDLKDLKSLTWTQGARISELDPCFFGALKNVRELFLGPGDYNDVSPLTNLTTLETLRISMSQVSDLKPLEKMVKMDRLDLGRTPVRDISVIAKMTNLTELLLDDTQVVDITPLAGLKKLETLSLKRTSVTKLAPLKDLPKLKTLRLEGTAVTDLNTIEPLRGRGLKIFLK